MSAVPSVGSGGEKPTGRLRSLTGDANWIGALLALLVFELIYFSITVSGFFGGGSGLLSLTEQFINVGVIALGVSFVIFAGDIDLSCGTMASFVSIVMAELWRSGLDIWLAALVAIAIAAAIGAVQGLIIAALKLESLLVTLASQFILGSLATAIGGSSPPYGFPSEFRSLVGTGQLGPIPTELIIFAVLGVIVAATVHRTGFGRSLVLLGHSPSAARYAGVNVTWTRVRAFMLSAIFAGIAGVLIAGFYNAARDDVGDALLLPAITTVVLGGVDIFGGRGHIAGVIVATFTLGFITQGMLAAGDSALSATMVTGGVLLICLAIKLSLEERNPRAMLDRLRRRLARDGP